MKNRALLLFAAFGFLATSLTRSLPARAQAPAGHEVVTKRPELAAIDGLDVGVLAAVTVAEGSSQKIEVSGPANIVGQLKIEVQGGTLRVHFAGPSPRRYEKLKISVTAPQLKRLNLGGAGDLTGLTPLTAPELELAISGAGNAKLTVANTRTSVRISGTGDVTLSGTTTAQDVHISGAGSYHAFGLKSADATASISGTGDGELNATNSLKAKISGVGSIRYRGNPASVERRISGVGRLTAANN